MKPSEKYTEWLTEFLAENGLTAYFLTNIKTKRSYPFASIQDYVEWLIKTKFNIRAALFMAFYWQTDDPIPWKIHSSNWHEFIDKKEKKNGCREII
jgi:hypothetical protein